MRFILILILLIGVCGAADYYDDISMRSDANITFDDGYIIDAKMGESVHYVTVGPYMWCDYETDGANDEIQINYAINNLTTGRSWKESVYLVGNIVCGNSIVLQNYTILDSTNAKINYIGDAAESYAFIGPTYSDGAKHDYEIHLGEVDGTQNTEEINIAVIVARGNDCNTPCQNVILTGGPIHGFGGFGVYGSFFENLYIHDFDCRNCTKDLIYLDNHNGTVVTAVNDYINHGLIMNNIYLEGSSYDLDTGVELVAVKNFSISNFVYEYPQSYGLWLWNCSDGVLSGINTQHSRNASIRLQCNYTKNIIISDVVSDDPATHGIWMYQVGTAGGNTSVIIDGATLIGSASAGGALKIEDSYNCIVNDIAISDTYRTYDIVVDNSHNIKMSNIYSFIESGDTDRWKGFHFINSPTDISISGWHVDGEYAYAEITADADGNDIHMTDVYLPGYDCHRMIWAPLPFATSIRNKLVYINSSGYALKADANAISTAQVVGIIATDTDSRTGAFVVTDGVCHTTGLTEGPYYLSATTAGGYSTAPPSGENDVVASIGYAISTTDLVIRPSFDYFSLNAAGAISKINGIPIA